MLQAVAQRSAAGTQAGDSASGLPTQAAAAKPEADESSPVMSESIPHKPLHNAMAGADSQQASPKEIDNQTNADVADQATNAMPPALPRQPSGTQDLPGGRVHSGAVTASSAMAEGSIAQDAPEAPKLITRTSQAEPAPKLKTGSRLAASIAKLAASKRAANDQPAPAAAEVKPSHGDGQKKSAIPEDIKRALLAKVC